ncbi:MAG: exo-alpha-sialidase [Acidobacteria bacterium]|nr:MAG: exo-alpha-sialidase [Acidobacteriota bacterium]
MRAARSAAAAARGEVRMRLLGSSGLFARPRFGAAPPVASFLLAAAVLFAAAPAAAQGPPPADMLVDPPQLVAEPSRAWGPRGLVDAGFGHLVALIHDQAYEELQVQFSSDDGRTWSLAFWEYNVTQAPAICSDRLGSVYLVWAQDWEPQRIYIRRSADFGQSWDPPLLVGQPNFLAGPPLLACNAAGQVFVLWMEAVGASRDLYAAGIDFSSGGAPVVAKLNDAPLADPQPALAAGWGRVGWAVWLTDPPYASVQFSRTRDGGATWSPPAPVPYPSILERTAASPRIAAQGIGTAAVAWLERPLGGRARVYVSSTSDGGVTWLGQPTQPDGGSCSGGDETLPRLCLGSAGLAVAFGCAVDPGRVTVGTNLSRDLGATWVYPSPVLPDDEDQRDLVALALACDVGAFGHLHVAACVEPRHGRQHFVSLRHAMGDPAWRLWEPHTAAPDGAPAQHGIEAVAAADQEGRGFLEVNLEESFAVGVNGTTAEVRLDTAEGPPGAGESSEPAVTGSGWPDVYAAWVYSSPIETPEILAAVSPDGGVNWIRSETPVAIGDVGAPALAAAGRGAGSPPPVLAVHTRRSPGSGVRVLDSAVSYDRGRTWQPAGQVSRTPDQGDIAQAVVCAPRGGPARVYAAWINERGEVRTNRWAPAVGWQPEDVRLDTPAPRTGYASGLPAIACDALGNVCVAWEDHRTIESQVRANCSHDFGASWQPLDVRLDQADGWDASRPALDADGAGALVVAFLENDPLLGRAVRVRHSCDGGATWSPVATPQQTYQLSARVDAAIEPRGHVLVAWTGDGPAVTVSASADWGHTWLEEQSFACSEATARCREEVSAELRADGGASLVYAFTPAFADRVDIRAVVSRDYGASWKGPFGLAPDGGIGHEGAGQLFRPIAGPVADAGGPGGPGAGDPVTAVWTAAPMDGSGSADVAAGRWRVPSGLPLEMRWLRFHADRLTLEWLPSPPEQADWYDLYRAPDGGPFGCLARGLTSPTFEDPERPAPGRAFFYVVTGVGPGGEGSAGRDLGVSCEPPPPECSL